MSRVALRRFRFSGLGVALLFLGLQGQVAAQVVLEPTQDPLAGSELFDSKGCVKCHAVNGIGGTEGPDLGLIPARRSFYELGASLWNHVPLMREGMRRHAIRRPQMSGREVADLIGFLFTLDYFDDPGDVSSGRRLFAEKRCFVCHRVGDYGGEVGPNLDFVGQYGSPILVAAAMWNHAAAMADTMEARGVKRPTFAGSELVDLIAYLESAAPELLEGRVYVLPGRAEAGRVVFVEKRCNRCHSVQGVGAQVGPDLAGQSRRWSLTEFAAAMWNKMPTMLHEMSSQGISVPALGAIEMADLVAYLYSIQYFGELGDAELGASHVRERGCLGCHALQGQGGQTATELSEASGFESAAQVIAALWNHAPIMRGDPEAVASPWPELSAAEVADITAFFQSLFADR